MRMYVIYQRKLCLVRQGDGILLELQDIHYDNEIMCNISNKIAQLNEMSIIIKVGGMVLQEQ